MVAGTVSRVQSDVCRVELNGWQSTGVILGEEGWVPGGGGGCLLLVGSGLRWLQRGCLNNDDALMMDEVSGKV